MGSIPITRSSAAREFLIDLDLDADVAPRAELAPPLVDQLEHVSLPFLYEALKS